jgi:AcrR family transcriptional regulator
MPKIVPDVRNKILSVAEAHFKEHGFEDTDMRKIAADVKIAVGTIYLHYQNKETLYLNVIEYSWKTTIEKIETISKQEFDPKELLKQILLELVGDMTNRKSLNSLWNEIGAMHHHKDTDLVKSHHFSGPHDPITQIISTILLKIAQKNQFTQAKQTFDQLGSFAFIMTVDLCMQERANTENRIELIVDLLNTYICKTVNQN